MTKPPKAQKVQVPRPENGRGKYTLMGGSNADEWNRHITDALMRAIPTSQAPFSPELQRDGKSATLVGIADCKPADPLEGLLLAQIMSANATGLELTRRAWLPEQSFECRTRFLALADKAARTVAMLVEALNRHRGKGQQKVTVEHVHVHAGGQAIVGAVSRQGGGAQSKIEEQPHAKATNASVAALQGEIEANGEVVPIASGERA